MHRPPASAAFDGIEVPKLDVAEVAQDRRVAIDTPNFPFQHIHLVELRLLVARAVVVREPWTARSGSRPLGGPLALVPQR